MGGGLLWAKYAPDAPHTIVFGEGLEGRSPKADSHEIQGLVARRRLSLPLHEEIPMIGNGIHDTQELRGLVGYLGETIVFGDCLECEIAIESGKWERVGNDVQNYDMPIGYACWKGMGIKNPNCDSWLFVEINQCCSLYGIFDGHGKDGHLISNYVKENLPKLILRDARFMTDEMPAMFRDVFRQMQDSIEMSDAQGNLDAQRSGTTATICVRNHADNKLTIAHIGDGACVLTSRAQNNLTVKKLTTDHQPDLCSERKRIEQAGGSVQFDGCVTYLIYQRGMDYPGLNISRCFGDLLGRCECGLSCEPDVNEVMPSVRCEILCLCTDGVFEIMSPEEMGVLVKDYTSDMLMEAAKALATESWERWLQEEGLNVVDDITVLLAHLPNVEYKV